MSTKSRSSLAPHPSPLAPFVVLGGAGAMGRLTVKDLFETAPSAKIVVADFNLPAAKKLTQTYRNPRIQATFSDISDPKATLALLKNSFAVINCAPYAWNLQVMRTAHHAGCHYLDLGGLFYTTQKQLELDSDFKKAGLTALLGIGAAPGITNLLARFAADQMEKVFEIHCRVGGIDETKVIHPSPLSSSYSLETILEEFSSPPAIFSKKQFIFPEPMSGREEYAFPPPIGTQKIMYTLHSEVATLPLTYKKKGIQEVSFKIGFGENFTKKIELLKDLGFTSKQPVPINGAEVIPRHVLVKLVNALPKPVTQGPLKQQEILRSVVKGIRHSKKETWVVDCRVAGIPKWDMGIDADTGCPPSIAAQMLARGEIKTTGAIPPEIAIPPQSFFKELKKRGMHVTHQILGDNQQSKVETQG